MSIAKKVIYGFIVLLSITIGAAAVSAFGLSSTISEFTGLISKEFEIVRHVSNAKISLLEARRPEKDLLYAEDPTLVKVGNEFIAGMLEEVARINALAPVSDGSNISTLIGQMTTLSNQYKTNFEAMAAAPLGQTRMMAALTLRKTAKELELSMNELLVLENQDIEAKSTAAQAFGANVLKSVAIAWVVVIAIGILIAVILLRAIVRPLNLIKDAITQVQQTGDFSKKVNYIASDEVGQTAAAFNSLMASLQQAISEVNQVVGALAVGDFDKHVKADLKGNLLVMKTAVNDCASSIKSTVTGLNSVMQALYNGQFNARLETDAQGEFKLAIDQALMAMKALEDMVGDVVKVVNGVAMGNLTLRVQVEARGDLTELKNNLNVSLDALSAAMRTISANARQVAAASGQTSNAIGQISDGAQNQSHAIGQVVTAVRQTVTSVSDVTNNTELASQKSRESVAVVRRGMEKMEHMVQLINDISANSLKINSITEVIENIANKTNLLSLNAAIEAARAGEHGKGFAVVADEVGKLAINSAESSQEIASLVQQAVSGVKQAVSAVMEVTQDMQAIEKSSNETNDMLAHISKAMDGQSSAVEEISSNLSNVDQVTRSNASASEEITSTILELSKIADSTRRETDKFIC
jgi:methyl-accepting chemotaxis protein